jgi:hypothetical protein
VEHWFHGAGGASKELLADFAAYGATPPPELLERKDCPIWPENAPAVELWLRCGTQWRSPEPTGICGLDYAIVLAMAKMYLTPETDLNSVLEDLQVMERRAIELIQERRAKG